MFYRLYNYNHFIFLPDDIFNVLLGIIDECLNEKCINQNYDVSRLVQISSASLLSFSIIRGDTDKMLKAINTILTSKYSAFHSMIVSFTLCFIN